MINASQSSFFLLLLLLFSPPTSRNADVTGIETWRTIAKTAETCVNRRNFEQLKKLSRRTLKDKTGRAFSWINYTVDENPMPLNINHHVDASTFLSYVPLFRSFFFRRKKWEENGKFLTEISFRFRFRFPIGSCGVDVDIVATRTLIRWNEGRNWSGKFQDSEDTSLNLSKFRESWEPPPLGRSKREKL